MIDSIVESVINKFKDRSIIGIEKYGTTLDRNDLTTTEWIKHAQEEAMDFVLYLEKLKKESQDLKNKNSLLIRALKKIEQVECDSNVETIIQMKEIASSVL